MTTAFVYAALTIFILGLFAVITDRTGERDQARIERDQARRDLKSANAEADLLAKTVRESAADIVKLDQENMTLHLRLTEAEIAAGVVHQIPPLRLLKGGAE